MARTRIHGQQVTDGSIELVDLSSALASTISGKADAGNLATVATTGSYNDLLNKPTLGSLSGSLDDLSDVTVTSPSNGQVLQYNGSAWVNGAAPSTFSGSYNDLTNKPTLASFTTLTSPASGQYLKFNGTAWVNSAIAAADLPVASNSGSGIVDTAFQIFAGDKRFNGLIQAYGGVAAKAPAINQPALRVQPYSASQSTSLIYLENPSGGAAYTVDTTGASAITLSSATAKGLIVKAAASQTANLFEVQNSSAGTLFSIDSNGYITSPGVKTNMGGGISVTGLGTGTSSYSSAGVHLNANQSAYGVMDMVGNNGGFIDFAAINEDFHGRLLYDRGQHGYYFHSRADATPKVCIDREGYGTLFVQPHAAAVKGLIVKAAASQTANLFEIQNSSGSVLFSIDKDGVVSGGSIPVATITGLATVATSGSYNDLSNKPTIPSIVGLASETYVDNKVAALVASAPSTLDTLNELATALGNDANFSTTMTNALAAKANTSSLAAVATSGSYNDLSNKPTIYTPVKKTFTSLVNGSTTQFVLDSAPAVAGTEQVFVNGLLQSPGAGDDYTISGATITFNTAPESGWKLVVYYFV